MCLDGDSDYEAVKDEDDYEILNLEKGLEKLPEFIQTGKIQKVDKCNEDEVDLTLSTFAKIKVHGK